MIRADSAPRDGDEGRHGDREQRVDDAAAGRDDRIDGDDWFDDEDELDRRALTQYLTVLEDVGRVRGADDLYLVVSQSGREYLVDHRDGVCECPDHRYRGRRCKHVRRVAFATGARPIPDWVDPSEVDDRLGEHVDGTPSFERELSGSESSEREPPARGRSTAGSATRR